jgi:AbrB family looped-hinge helix DNA binding protein
MVNGMTLTIDKAGRIVVPKAIRDQFALHPGSELALEPTADGFHLRVTTARPLLETRGKRLVCTAEVPPAAWDIPAILAKQREARASAQVWPAP